MNILRNVTYDSTVYLWVNVTGDNVSPQLLGFSDIDGAVKYAVTFNDGSSHRYITLINFIVYDLDWNALYVDINMTHLEYEIFKLNPLRN